MTVNRTETPPTADQIERIISELTRISETGEYPEGQTRLPVTVDELRSVLLAALAPAERALTGEEQQIFHDALRASTTQRSPGYRKAPAERAEAVPDYVRGRFAGLDEAVEQLVLREGHMPEGESLVETRKCISLLRSLAADHGLGLPERPIPAPTRAGALDAAGEKRYVRNAVRQAVMRLRRERPGHSANDMTEAVMNALAAGDGDAGK